MLKKLGKYIARPISELIVLLKLVRTIRKDGRITIVTPKADQTIDEEANYHKQFETRIYISGDMLYYVPKQSAYPSEQAWNNQMHIHNENVQEYVDHLDFHVLFASISATVSCAFYAITIDNEWKELDIESFGIAIGVLVFQYFFRGKLTSILFSAIRQVINFVNYIVKLFKK